MESTQARSTCYRLFHSEYIYQVQSTLPLMNELIVRQISTSFPISNYLLIRLIIQGKYGVRLSLTTSVVSPPFNKMHDSLLKGRD